MLPDIEKSSYLLRDENRELSTENFYYKKFEFDETLLEQTRAKLLI